MPRVEPLVTPVTEHRAVRRQVHVGEIDEERQGMRVRMMALRRGTRNDVLLNPRAVKRRDTVMARSGEMTSAMTDEMTRGD